MLVRDPLRLEVVPCLTGVLPVPIPPSSVVNLVPKRSCPPDFADIRPEPTDVGRKNTQVPSDDAAREARVCSAAGRYFAE